MRKHHPAPTDGLADGSWYYFDEQASQKNNRTTVAVINAQRQEIRRLELDAFHSTFLAGERYLVLFNGQHLQAFDLSQDALPSVALQLPVSATYQPSGRLHESRIVLLTTAVSLFTVQLLDIEPSGIKLRASWPIGRPGQIVESGTSVTVVNQALDGLERRSLESGELLERYPLPAGLDLAAIDMGFSEHYISTLDKSMNIRHFHAATGQELNLGVSTMIPISLPGTSLGLFLSRDPNDQRAFLVDKATNQLRWTFVIPRCSTIFADVMPNGEIWLIGSRMGLTATLLDANSGQVIRTLQPFAWVPWALVAVCLSAGVWFVSWRSFVKSNRWTIWWEVYPLLIFVLGLMTFRMWFMYEPTSFSRIPTAIGYAAVLASLQVAVLWIWVGHGRIIDRLVHLVAVFFIVGLSFRMLHTPSPNDWPSMLFLYCAFPTVGFLLTPLLLCKTRIYKHLREQSRSEAVREVYSLRTFMAITAWSALLVMVYGTFMPSLVRIPFVQLSYGYFAGSAAVGLVATFAALSSHRLVHRSAAALALLLMLALLIYISSLAIVGTEPFYRNSTIRFRVIALGTTYSLTFWLVSNARCLR